MLKFYTFLFYLITISATVTFQSVTPKLLVSPQHDNDQRYFSGWFGTSNSKGTERFLPAALQVLEHTASHVNASWSAQEAALLRGARPMVPEEVQPLPGLLRLTVLRNSLLSEARAAHLDNSEGFSPAVEQRLQSTTNMPLPEQLAAIIEYMLHADELKASERQRGHHRLSQLAADMVVELRDSASQLATALRQFPPLQYAP